VPRFLLFSFPYSFTEQPSQMRTLQQLQVFDFEKRLNGDFFTKDVLEVAPGLLGKSLVRKFVDGSVKSFLITETEAYRGEEDLACHASKGRTQRTEVMYQTSGIIYIYLIYGMYWMLNIVTGKKNQPQATLIRAIEGYNGPGKLSRALELDKSFNGENLLNSERIWIADNQIEPEYYTTPRIGIEYAGDIWKNKPWRYIIKTV
jgi:DNA-3-methyladenine glycosylase